MQYFGCCKFCETLSALKSFLFCVNGHDVTVTTAFKLKYYPKFETLTKNRKLLSVKLNHLKLFGAEIAVKFYSEVNASNIQTQSSSGIIFLATMIH